MKALIKISFAALTLIAFISCKEKQTVKIDTPEQVKKEEKMTADIADQDFVDGMTGKIWHNYLEIKMALTEEDANQVQKIAKSMADSFSEERATMKSISQKMADTDDIEKQRELFAQFTEKAGPMFEDALSGGTIYKKFCPMAFNNKGAYWYADVKEISNPFFGDKMPKCGSVEKTISK
ncbi:DUF3347 domain-containing protein [Zunongwangia sp. F363]|uniref:DUF3347 domain-containing protein n=1 Tax=Autumnicola tepida TaxID=3075595 RepID=A0ABU3C6I2_9FLAO|nr:DUF3347 domain-containing protein [Zunongwangia sp. F363]MDT0641946.1 DUF3347 domain-containing protein [Zunongwangia sp. F363]